MKTESIYKKFESFIVRASGAISTLQVKVGKDADEQARITIRIANLHLASTYCKAVLIKNNYTPTDAKALIAFNSASYEAKDLEGAPVLNNLDDVYAAYITFRALLADTDGFMYKMWVKTGTIIYVTLHWVNKYTFRLVWEGCVWLWTKTKGFFTKDPEAPVVNPETITTPEAIPVAETTPEAPVDDSETLPDVSDKVDSDFEDDASSNTVVSSPEATIDGDLAAKKLKWNNLYRGKTINEVAEMFIEAEGKNEELFSLVFGVTPEYVSKIFDAVCPAKEEVAGPKSDTTSNSRGKSSKKGKKS